MEDGSKMVDQQMDARPFRGLLDHKNPSCEVCLGRCMSLYSGGKKDRMSEMFLCSSCGIIYVLPPKKRCKFTEAIP